MATTVFITNNPLHILYSLAIIKKKDYNNNYIILWFGVLPVENYFFPYEITKNYNILDLSHLDFNHYKRGVRKNYDIFINIIKNKIMKIDYLFTCFDTHLAFEIVRHHFSIQWNQVGIIEDGIGNYFKNSQPDLIRQIPKSILNKVEHSFFLNVTRSNLGGNPKVGIVSTLSPDFVYINKKSSAKVISISNEFRTVLNEINIDIPSDYKAADVIIFLSPVLAHKRMKEAELISYLKFVNKNILNNSYKNIMIKPHPREDMPLLEKLVYSIYNKDITIADQRPIELYLNQIKAKIWSGMPSTGMLNNFFLQGKGKAKYLISPPLGKGSRYLKTGLDTMKKIMGDDLVIQFFK